MATYGLYQQYVGEGCTGGYTFSWKLFGRNIAKLCDYEILGKVVSDNKFKEIKCSEYTFDYKKIKKFGLRVDQLPIESILINREYTLWELYHNYILAILFFIIIETALIIALVINRASRIKAGREILRINDELELKVFERTAELNQSNVMLSEELTERTRAEQIIIESEQKLKELVATKDRFFSIIAHDLRNPFNSLLGFSELLVRNAQRYSVEKIQNLANVLNTTSKQSYTLLENLLEWSRLQTGAIELQLVELNPNELTDEVRLLCEPLAASKDIDLQLYVNYDGFVKADPDMIKTVLRNLVTNAIKFTYPQGHVWISIQRVGDHVLFTVSDTGTGIDQEHLDKLFKIESKLSQAGTAAEKGTGLGLILCKEFIVKHSGKIWAESKLGKGSDFKFTIPLYPVD